MFCLYHFPLKCIIIKNTYHGTVPLICLLLKAEYENSNLDCIRIRQYLSLFDLLAQTSGALLQIMSLVSAERGVVGLSLSSVLPQNDG